MTTKTVTRTYGDGTTETRILLTADAGKALTNDGGATLFNCVEVVSASGWAEIAAPISEDDEATEADYLAALAELGVSE